MLNSLIVQSCAAGILFLMKQSNLVQVSTFCWVLVGMFYNYAKKINWGLYDISSATDVLH